MNVWDSAELFAYRKLVSWYRLPDDIIQECDLIAPHCYGLLQDDALPDGTVKTITQTAKLATHFPEAVIIMASATYFGAGRQKIEDDKKRALFQDLGVSNRIITVAEGCTNSVTEVRAIKHNLQQYGIRHTHPAIICDAPHMRSCRTIWKTVFCDGQNMKIGFVGIDAAWNQAHRAFWQQSPLRWFAANVMRDITLHWKGLDYVAQIHHPVR